MSENNFNGGLIGYGSGYDYSCYCTGQCVGLGYCPQNQQYDSIGERKPAKETPEEKAKRLGVKLYEDKAKDWSPQNPNPVIGVCGRCGIEIRMYNTTMICSEIGCPAGRGPQVY